MNNEDLVIRSVSDGSRVTARQVLAMCPSTGDTTGAVELLRRMERAGKLQAYTARPGANKTFGLPEAGSKSKSSSSTRGSSRSTEVAQHDKKEPSRRRRRNRATQRDDAALLAAFTHAGGRATASEMMAIARKAGLNDARRKATLRRLVDTAQIAVQGRTAGAVYSLPNHTRHRHQAAPTTPVARPEQILFATVDQQVACLLVACLQAERIAYALLLKAACKSKDPAVKKLAVAAKALRLSSKGMM